VRRTTFLIPVAAALTLAAPAAADFQPLSRPQGELATPGVWAGTIAMPAARSRGRVRVIVTLPDPPLAAFGRTLAGRGTVRRLNVSSLSSRVYLARLEAAQRAAVAVLTRAIPEATVSRRYRIVLDGLAVELPAGRLPELVSLPFAARVYPSYRYTLALDRSPGLIGADRLGGPARAGGAGVKIAIVDDGLDQENRFLDPAGLAYPPGFPKGGTKWTTPKVIVARAFPGPGSGRAGRLPLDPKESFHGTHVAGIAAGAEGTNAPAGADHPATAGLSGVAPKAWLGNYRVFNVPTPIGNQANSPEIVAAFEAAVADGMDVINFSGGGPQSEPVNDVLVEAIRNVALAGVVPVVSAGNDRDDYGAGSTGSPGTAPDAIAVAAVSNDRVFAPALDVTGAPASLQGIPFVGASGGKAPADWGSADRALVDVGSLVGGDGAPVGRRLCGAAANPNGGPGPLRPGAIAGALALVWRGECTFASKARRAREAGAIGIVVVDNRAGEANEIPVSLPIPGGMVADLDGERLRAYLAGLGGRAPVRIGRSPRELATGRSGVMTSFSAEGPTAFGHLLKPDLAAPGGQILSATSARSGGPFAVFDGTSMAAPHVSGAAALLLERHPGWSPAQVRSALVSTAGAAWADTARTTEASVLLAGGGLVDVVAADDPQLFTSPTSLSFGDLNVSGGPARQALLLSVTDAGGGGTWTVELRPQSQPAGAALEVPSLVTLAPGGTAEVPVVVRAGAAATAGDGYGFLLLRRGAIVRKVPYAFFVTRPRLESSPVLRLRAIQRGDTRRGVSRAGAYRYPGAAFGPPPAYADAPVREDGAETLYRFDLERPVANAGAAIISASDGSLVHPWLLGSKDENDVQGYAGTPVNVNQLTPDYPLDVGAAATVFPTPGTYYVSVDSGRDRFTGAPRGGSYLLRSWVNDVTPPLARFLTVRVSTGRPTLAVRALDGGAGVNPYSLRISYAGVTIGASAYDPVSGIALFRLPADAPPLKAGERRLIVSASDFQEAKNVSTSGDALLPNTTVAARQLQVVAGPAVTWLEPSATGRCLEASERLDVVASAPVQIVSVRFLDGARLLATARTGAAGLYRATWRTKGAAAGRHELRTVVTDASGRTAEARQIVQVCRAAGG